MLKKQFVLLLVFVHGITFGQQSSVSNYYLIDTAHFFQLSPNERQALEIEIKAFHRAKNDTVRIKHVQAAYSVMNDNDVWIEYVRWIDKEIKTKKIRQRFPVFYIRMMAVITNDFGYFYSVRGNHDKALHYYIQGYKFKEKTGSKRGMANALHNIALVYHDMDDIPKAKEYNLKSIRLSKETNSKDLEANTLTNLAVLYQNNNQNDSALLLYREVLTLYKETNKPEHTGTIYGHMGTIFAELNQFDSALIYANRGLELHEKYFDKAGITDNFIELSEIYYALGNYPTALENGVKGLKFARELHFPSKISRATGSLHLIYKKLNQPAVALEMYEQHIKLRDSVYSEESKIATTRQQIHFEYEKKEIQLKTEQEKKKAEFENASKIQKVIIYSVIAGLFLVCVFSVFLYRRFRLTRKQKIIIEEQKQRVDDAYVQLEEKQKEILDSIRYAKRIQQAILPSERYISRHLKKE